MMNRKFALIIGNGEYKDSNLSCLGSPDTDVDGLSSVLNDHNIGRFDQVSSFVNQSSNIIRKEIARFFRNKKRDDLLLLYFSGHGVLDDQGDLYLAVEDTERDLLSAMAIPASFITAEMDRSLSRRQVLILDCCHSGAFTRGGEGRDKTQSRNGSFVRGYWLWTRCLNRN